MSGARTSRTIAFVTGNPGKLEEVRRIWASAPGGPPAELEAVDLDLPEIQSLDLIEVLRAKAEEAHRRLGRPVVVDETGLAIDAFGGFPGPLVKWMLEALGPEGMASAALAAAERSGAGPGATALCAALYFDGNGDGVVGEGAERGALVVPGRGGNGFGWDPVFRPERAEAGGLTYGELPGEGKDRFGHRGQAWRALAAALRGRLAAVALVLLPLVSGLLGARPAAAQADPVSRSWNQPVEPFRIAGNLYYVGASDVTSFLLATPEGHIVIDGGFVETAPQILANVRRLGFRVEDVRILLESHAHYDHAGGLAELRRATGATLWASRSDAPLLARGGHRDPQLRDRFPFPPAEPDRVFDDGDTISLGGTTLTARVTAGHTPGCTTWTTTVTDAARSYDVAFLCSPTVPGPYVLTTNPRYPDAVADYRKGFEVLRSLHPDIWLASHGSFFDLATRIETRDFLDGETYSAFVESMASAFEARVASETLVIHDVTVIDGTGAPPRANADVLVRDGRIAAVEDARTFVHPDGARIVDAAGKFLLPGLIDMHAHVAGDVLDEEGKPGDRWERDVALSFLRTMRRFGVTTVRDPGAILPDALLLRRLLEAGEVDGPRLVTAGRILIASDFRVPGFVPVHDEAEVRDEIRWQALAGVDLVKVYSSMPPDLVAAAIDEAHAHGLPVIGHLQRTTWTEAARLGIDGVEHAAPWSSAYVRAEDRAAAPPGLFARVHWLEHLDEAAIDEMIDALVEHGVVVDPTLMATMQTKFWADDPRWTENPDLEWVPERVRRGWAAGGFTKGWTPAQFAEAKRSWPILLGLVRRMYDRGVTLVAGTDTPTPWIVPGASLHDELALLHEAGIPPLEVLEIATSNAARALGLEDEIGSIRPGLRADLVLLSADPLASIRNTRSIELVIQGGAVVSSRQDPEPPPP